MKLAVVENSYKRRVYVPKKRVGQNRLKTVGKKSQRVSQRKKEKSISKLMKEADALMSKNVRYANIDKDGNATCYTCGHKAEPKKMQNGHYLSRFYKAARWHPDNTRIQCYVCNIFKKGDVVVFRQNLVKEIGIERVEAVEAQRNVTTKLTREYLLDLLEKLSVNV